jgi:hypothetical protein
MKRLLALAVCLATLSYAADRSSAQTRAFQRQNPCPANDARRGPCPGHVIDHIQPLCAGGADHPLNLQWQTVLDAKRKDLDEWRLCRLLKKTAVVNPWLE